MTGSKGLPVSGSHVRVPQPCGQSCQWVGLVLADLVSEGGGEPRASVHQPAGRIQPRIKATGRQTLQVWRQVCF